MESLLTFLSHDDLNALMPEVDASPKNEGTVEMMIIRRETNARESRQEVFLAPELGMEGDRWFKKKEEDPEYLAQITAMNHRFLRAIALQDERMPLAGDNLVLDMDLSEENLPVGQKLRIGEAELVVSPKPHRGCLKFIQRFGKTAMVYVNAKENRHLRLRGVYLTITKAGLVRQGDKAIKID